MRLIPPEFWYAESDDLPPAIKILQTLCRPLSSVYDYVRRLREKYTEPYISRLPIICVGNLVIGGSGKTPSAVAVLKLLQRERLTKNPFFLTRGYGGKEEGPIFAALSIHKAEDVGDESLLLSRHAQTVVAAHKGNGARFAEINGADMIVMDDGFQNPTLQKSFNILVINGIYGFGNEEIFPAGPLREPLSEGLKKADAFILIGKDRKNVRSRLPQGKPVFEADVKINATYALDLRKKYVAFAGIAHPEKFRKTLEAEGAHICSFHAFQDHHNFTAQELEALEKEAATYGATLITTEKDAMRLSKEFRQKIAILPVELAWKNPDEVAQFVKQTLSNVLKA